MYKIYYEHLILASDFPSTNPFIAGWKINQAPQCDLMVLVIDILIGCLFDKIHF